MPVIIYACAKRHPVRPAFPPAGLSGHASGFPPGRKPPTGAVQDIIGHFFAVMGRQRMHENHIFFGLVQNILGNLDNRQKPGAVFRILLPVPCWSRHRYRLHPPLQPLPGVYRCKRSRLRCRRHILWRCFKIFSGTVYPSGEAILKLMPIMVQASIRLLATLLPSPI